MVLLCCNTVIIGLINLGDSLGVSACISNLAASTIVHARTYAQVLPNRWPLDRTVSDLRCLTSGSTALYSNRITFYSSRIHRLASPPSTTSDDDSLGHVRLAGREESARGLHDAGAKVFDIQARCMRPCEDVVPAVRSPFLCFSSSVVGNHPAYYSCCRVGQCASQRTGGSLSGRGCPPSGTEMYAVG